MNAYFVRGTTGIVHRVYLTTAGDASKNVEVRGQSLDKTALVALGSVYSTTDSISDSGKILIQIPTTNAASGFDTTGKTAVHMVNLSGITAEQLQLSGITNGTGFISGSANILTAAQVTAYNTKTTWAERLTYLTGADLTADQKLRIATQLLYKLMAPSEGIVYIPSLRVYAFKSGSTYRRLYYTESGTTNKVVMTAPEGTTIASRMTANEIVSYLPYYYNEDELKNTTFSISDESYIYRGEMTYINKTSNIYKTTDDKYYVEYTKMVYPINPDYSVSASGTSVTRYAVVMDDSNGRQITGTKDRSWFNSAFTIFYNDQEVTGLTGLTQVV
jgi:hypothetical protein